MFKKLLFLVLLFKITLASGQEVYTPGTEDDLILSFLDMKNPKKGSNVYNYSIRYYNDSLNWNPWSSTKNDKQISIISPRAGMFYNSNYARGYNDGAVWKGKGLTTELHGGIKGRFKKLYFTFQPVMFFSQNSTFPLVADSVLTSKHEYNYKLAYGIDYVQRYGNSSYVDFDWGQSEIRYLGKWFTAAVSTQNFTFGPVEINPILMSKNASGIPNLHLGTSKPIDIKIKSLNLGSFESHFHYGLMTESEYFDEQSDNNYSYFNAWTLGYTPPILQGLSFGFSKALYKDFRYFEASDLYSFISVKDDGVVVIDNDTLDFANDTFDQLASFFVQYHDPEYGIKVYLEFAKNDFNGKEQFLTEPMHARAYSIGFQKLYELSDKRLLKFTYEHTNLIRSPHSQYRTASPRFYVHHANTHGYTNNGQIMGAGSGPGSNTDYLSIDWLSGTTLSSIFGQRISFNEDFFIAEIQDKTRHDVEYTLGLSRSQKLNNLIITGEFLGSYRFNRYYAKNDDTVNVGLNISVKYILN